MAELSLIRFFSGVFPDAVMTDLTLNSLLRSAACGWAVTDNCHDHGHYESTELGLSSV